MNGIDLVVSDGADDRMQYDDAVCKSAAGMHTPGWPQFLASHLSSPMKAARAIGRRQGMLTTKNLNFRYDYAQATGDQQHLCALFSAQLVAYEKRGSV
ncbi:hypothetical protein TcBrA4_0063670 [Trypanosoma cruzi]|nr:hypothetical protein TcBrA4_0063670 [Trypanosoma cruzi]